MSSFVKIEAKYDLIPQQLFCSPLWDFPFLTAKVLLLSIFFSFHADRHRFYRRLFCSPPANFHDLFLLSSSIPWSSFDEYGERTSLTSSQKVGFINSDCVTEGESVLLCFTLSSINTYTFAFYLATTTLQGMCGILLCRMTCRISEITQKHFIFLR